METQPFCQITLTTCYYYYYKRTDWSNTAQRQLTYSKRYCRRW